ncbi:MAG: hypothetical protein K2X74_22635 [Acetobacteraceae bacterium]|nr:hypothetical protein [Acetobacteraceae bacterium]
MRAPALAALLALLTPVAAPAQQPVPMCLAEREGMTACFADKLCLCRYEPGGSLTGRPPGFRWDCGALRPGCGVVPPDAGPAAPLPPVFLQPTLPAPWSGPAEPRYR